MTDVYIYSYFSTSLRPEAIGNLAVILAIPRNPENQVIERYQNYLKLNDEKGSLVSPDGFIRKMISSKRNSIVFCGVSEESIARLDDLSPYPKPSYMGFYSYNIAMIENATRIFLATNVPNNMCCALLNTNALSKFS